MPNQPGFTVNTNRIPGTEFDNLSDEDLRKLINSTGRITVNSVAPPPPPKKVVNLEHIFGGING